MKRGNFASRKFLVFGFFLIGLFLSFYIEIKYTWELVQDECHSQATENFVDKFGDEFEPHLNLVNKPLAAKKPVKNVIRPRYYSSELGIREKLFIGVITTQEKINTLATAFNRTSAHLVNKIKFFINADNVKSSFKLKNIVGFTDTRENLRPFHILKYIADNYLDDFDYFLLAPDTTYVDARQLKMLLYNLSISFDIFMGKKCENSELSTMGIESDRNYCDLDAGILLSSSVIRKVRANLDWCVRNAVTNYHSVNIGKCVKYSSKVTGCQEGFQGIQIKSYKLETNKLYRDLNHLTKDAEFRNSTIIYPIANTDDFYILHAHFSRLHLDKLTQQNSELEQKAYHIANGTISNNILEIRWPLGVPEASIPQTRYDLLTWEFLNTTHIFMPTHDVSVDKLSKIDFNDLEMILNKTIFYAKRKYPAYRYENLHTAYRRFDPVRGMDYRLHFNFIDNGTNRRYLKSFDVVKPLGRVEVVPSPYVTESTRIAILLPTFEHQSEEALEFVKQYQKICMENQDNTFLMVIFLYRADTKSKGDWDVFRHIKTLALNLSKKYKTDGSRIAWVSIRLPQEFSQPFVEGDILINSLYGRNEILSLAVTDLALRKIGLESLVMLGSNSMTFKADFLNRVRMNTIQSFQIYAPIGFMSYPCNFMHFCKECETCDVSQGTGYFDKQNYDVISFYSRDYVEARRRLENLVPIIRSDNDIANLLQRNDKTINNVIDMFVKAQLQAHILRAVEPNLRFGLAIKNFIETRKSIPKCSGKILGSDNIEKCLHLASRKQIGEAIIRYEDKIADKKN